MSSLVHTLSTYERILPYHYKLNSTSLWIYIMVQETHAELLATPYTSMMLARPENHYYYTTFIHPLYTIAIILN